ncbi:hypothetical protein [Actinomycetospora aeridis]|uniref:Uncharacterized protein n=1 Tax=Actinomycetospora aeridis TaxID=3129231 RepID=A0ABU8NA48_9PSEU
MSTRRHDPGSRGQWPIPTDPQGVGWALLRHRSLVVALLWVIGPLAVVWVATGSWEVMAALAGCQAAALAVPDLRDALGAQVRRLVIERRLRTAFLELPVCNRSGTVPTVVRSAARTNGTYVLVWCPAGVTVAQLGAEAAALAEACFVDEVVVEPHSRWPNMAVLFVVRHGLGTTTGSSDGPVQ